MSLEGKLSSKVEEILKTDTVTKAQRFFSAGSGVKVLALISFFESALVAPIITDPFLVAAILADKTNTVRLVLATTIASVLGGIIAYLTAIFFLETLMSLVSTDLVSEFNNIVNSNDSNVFVLTLVGAVTPVPYTVVAWAVAVLKGSLITFIIGSILGRGFRYMIVGYCVYKFGPSAISYAKKYIGLVSVLLIVIVAIFLWHKM